LNEFVGVLSNSKFAQNRTREMANFGFGTLGKPGMRIFGLAGWSGSGKTTLLAALLPELVA
jgi:ABC-type dipeptide/oligopeptide/nickel transport system ATPase subunit